MALQVTSINFNALENAKNHHTDRYEIVRSDPPIPVIRRGQEFTANIQFDREFIPNEDKIKITFDVGK